MLFSGKLKINKRLLLVLIAFLIAYLIHYFKIDLILSQNLHSLGILGAVIAGAFYTFGITTPTAFLILIEIMAMNNYLLVAIIASLTAAIVDTVLFVLLKKQLEQNAKKLMEVIHDAVGKYNIIFSIFGFLMFGLPLPDELGLAFMQISEIKPKKILAIVFSAKLITLLSVYFSV